jgi:hypothetical protein
MRLLLTACLVVSAPIASAAPVVVRWPEGQTNVWVSDYTNAIAPLQLRWISDMQSGMFNFYPLFAADGWDPFLCDPTPFVCEQVTANGYHGTPVGTPISGATSGWETGFYCFIFETPWPSALTGDQNISCGGSGCPPFAVHLGSTMDDGVNVFPIRVLVAEGANWYYGWVAVRATRAFVPDCELCVPNPPEAMEQSVVEYIGIGLETQPETPIINGGGLCEADLNYDAVLDLADVQAFAQGFLAGDPIADLNGDGILDLADIQRFVSSFNSGCGL